jgi:glucose-1-phosphate cytidylyltransferase
MKVVILAGGFGTRISEETDIKPKPMIDIGGKPVLWHIMKAYSYYGLNDFIICLGYKGYMIKEYFANYFLHESNVTIDLTKNSFKTHSSKAEPWKITLIDTGMNTMTGGRIKIIEEYTGKKTFMLTYGDGVSNINIKTLLEFHKKHKKPATLTAVQPTGRFGALQFGNKDNVLTFKEKPKGDGTWVNAGFFVLEPEIFDYIKGDTTIWEEGPLEKLAKEGNLMAYKHQGFWMPMDTLRDKKKLEALWQTGNAPWKLW